MGRKPLQGASVGKKGDSAPIINTRESLLVPTGATLLNLALSGKTHGAFKPGTLVNIVGDSSAGKTFLAWSVFAEMVYDKRFDDWDLIYDDVESKLQLSVRKLFGPKITRVEKLDEDERSELIEQFADRIFKQLKKKRPFVYVLDSFDALSDAEEAEKEELKRDYPAKPRLASQLFRMVCSDLEKTESVLIVVSQTRDAIGVMFGSKKRRSGGNALRFYCMQELWLAVRGHIKRRKRDVGVDVLAKAKKNHLTGRLETVGFPILVDYGVDDIGSMIDWLVSEGFWKKKTKQTIDAKEFGEGRRESLITQFDEDRGKLEELREAVGSCWQEIEESIATKRRPKYE